MTVLFLNLRRSFPENYQPVAKQILFLVLISFSNNKGWNWTWWIIWKWNITHYKLNRSFELLKSTAILFILIPIKYSLYCFPNNCFLYFFIYKIAFLINSFHSALWDIWSRAYKINATSCFYIPLLAAIIPVIKAIFIFLITNKRSMNGSEEDEIRHSYSIRLCPDWYSLCANPMHSSLSIEAIIIDASIT